MGTVQGPPTPAEVKDFLERVQAVGEEPISGNVEDHIPELEALGRVAGEFIERLTWPEQTFHSFSYSRGSAPNLQNLTRGELSLTRGFLDEDGNIHEGYSASKEKSDQQLIEAINDTLDPTVVYSPDNVEAVKALKALADPWPYTRKIRFDLFKEGGKWKYGGDAWVLPNKHYLAEPNGVRDLLRDIDEHNNEVRKGTVYEYRVVVHDYGDGGPFITQVIDGWKYFQFIAMAWSDKFTSNGWTTRIDWEYVEDLARTRQVAVLSDEEMVYLHKAAAANYKKYKTILAAVRDKKADGEAKHVEDGEN